MRNAPGLESAWLMCRLLLLLQMKEQGPFTHWPETGEKKSKLKTILKQR